MALLNLQKNDVLDLTKKDPSLNNIILATGWDVVKRGLFSFSSADVDLDLVALLLNEDGKLIDDDSVIFFNNQRHKGIFLHNDNRTGQGQGDDEKISITLNSISDSCQKIVFAINIYKANERRQDFSKVKNAYIRLMNADKSYEEICRYNLSEEGGKKTTLVFAELERRNNEWSFRAVGELLNADLEALTNKYN